MYHATGALRSVSNHAQQNGHGATRWKISVEAVGVCRRSFQSCTLIRETKRLCAERFVSGLVSGPIGRLLLAELRRSPPALCHWRPLSCLCHQSYILCSVIMPDHHKLARKILTTTSPISLPVCRIPTTNLPKTCCCLVMQHAVGARPCLDVAIPSREPAP